MSQIVPIASKVATAQVVVGTTAVLLVAARPTRTKLIILSPGGSAIQIGTSSVTSSTGCVLPFNTATEAGIGNFDYTGELWGVMPSGTATISVMELYN